MKVAICQSFPDTVVGYESWQQLVSDVRAAKADLLLLNEMPFGKWVSALPEKDRDMLFTLHRQHDEGMSRLSDFDTAAILGTRATFEGEKSVNEAFAWTSDGAIQRVHTKQFFPNEPGYYEARWFERGDLRFETAEVRELTVGFLICTDVMFNEWARHYRREGVHLIAVPRATPPGSEQRWQSMLSAAAIVSGCYVASSNRGGIAADGQEFAGRGWIFGPTGELLAETASNTPVATVDLDLALVRRAQAEYPCYVQELAP